MNSTTFTTTNPATAETLESYTHLTTSEIETAVAAAFKAYEKMKTKSVPEKIQQLHALGKSFRSHARSLAECITLEIGKPIKDSLAEVEKCAMTFDHFAKNLESLLATESIKSSYGNSVVVKDSLGPILSVMPWNFPLWQLVRFAAPAVGIGNPILLKHSEVTAGCAKRVADIFSQVSTDLLYNLTISHEQTAQVLSDSRVRAVTLTGSAAAGRTIAELAGKYLKKSVLELGGSDAYIVFADADLALAAKTCAVSRMINNGQSCISAKRFLVHHTVLDLFTQKFCSHLQSFSYGDPMSMKTTTGSLAAKKFQQQLFTQCKALEKTGNVRKIFDLADSIDFDLEAPTAFFPARAYAVQNDEEKVFAEEFFGPVALVQCFKDDSEALQLVNKSVYGLGGAVFSADLNRAESFARKMEAGFVAINEMVKSAPNLPFGGVKNSGYGRELGLYGFNEFCNIKTLGFQ